MALQTRSLLLLILSLGLASAQNILEEVPVQPDFEAQQVAGRWLTVGLAASHTPLVSPEDPLRLGLHSIQPRGEDLEFVFFWMGQGVCRGLNVTVQPTGLRGQYHGSIDGGGSMLVRFVSTDDSNLLLHVHFEDGGEVTSLWALLARTERGDPKWLGKFREYIRGFRLQEAPVFNLDAGCPPLKAHVRATS